MRKIVSLFVIFLLLSAPAFSQGDKSYEKTLKKMFEVSGSEESYKAVIKQMFDMFKDQYPETERKIMDEMEGEFLKTSLDDLVEMLVPVYKKYMSEEELQELIKFYQTPVGKKYAKNTPAIMQESMQLGQQWGLKIGQKFQEKLAEKKK
jgi:uncharacterized protein